MKRTTIQKTLVLEAVNELKCHPTAEEIYTYVAKAHPTISRGTVYRNLNQLADDNTVSRVKVPNGPDSFDFCLTQHYHVRCTDCGRVFDVAMPYDERLISKVSQKDGFTINGYDLIFFGICPACNLKNQQ